MNIQTTITRLLVLVFALSIFGITANAKGNKHKAHNTKSATKKASHKGHHHHHHHHHKKVASGKHNKMSLYQWKATWTNQDGKKVKWSSFKGRVQVIAMIYTHCLHACPVIVSDIKRIAEKLPKKLQSKVSYILVTIDPKRDTPSRLKKFSKIRQLPSSQWTLLHGSSTQILELAALLGVKYKRTSKSDFAHTNLITVLDKEGVIRSRQIGLGKSPKNSVAAIKKALASKPSCH
jgi:protein SCO1/2